MNILVMTHPIVQNNPAFSNCLPLTKPTKAPCWLGFYKAKFGMKKASSWQIVAISEHLVHLTHSLIQDLTEAFVLIKHLMSAVFVLHFSYLVLKSHLCHELVLVWADQSVTFLCGAEFVMQHNFNLTHGDLHWYSHKTHWYPNCTTLFLVCC